MTKPSKHVPPTQEESPFASFFSERSTSAVAHSMYDAFRIGIRETIRNDRLAHFAEYDHASRFYIDAYDYAVSLHQGAMNMSGALFNKLVTYGISYLFSNWDVLVEQKVRVSDKRDIDQLCQLPKGDVYFSATTSPQERKDGTWSKEYEAVVSYRSVMGLKKDFQFIGVFGEAKTNCSIKASAAKRQRLVDLMPQAMEVVCIHDVEHTAQVLSNLVARFV